MKTWSAYLMLAMLLSFQLEAKAQSSDEAQKSGSQEAKFVYLELDDVFAEAASRETNNRISTAESQQFGRNVESQLATSRRLEPEAAKLLLELQANPNAEAVIENASTADL
ncbi:MAG TPA: hypothetical protein VJT74_05275, partial [Pyrinomonadaceae bacterium]|nr:hypothetical protein [Pyrinomonadaceae bacterium]